MKPKRTSDYITVMSGMLVLTLVIPGLLYLWSNSHFNRGDTDQQWNMLFLSLPLTVGFILAIVISLTMPSHILRAHPRYANSLLGWTAVAVSLAGLAFLAAAYVSQ